MRRCTLVALLSITTLTTSGCVTIQTADSDIATLKAMHENVLEFHRQGKLEAWLAQEADVVVSANRGQVSFSSADERRARREPYLSSTTFDVYRDLREPVVKVSDDGTLGWVIAEVEMKGSSLSESGERVAFEAVWAWIELYEKQGGAWKAVGNVSNRRP
ncbi:MAG: hypothetical protein QNJ05_03875 [Woeseiaceae bacterium]|nr:hypothetical protein [Woeseiaceae bacterium]